MVAIENDIERLRELAGSLLPHERTVLLRLTPGEKLALEESKRIRGSEYFERYGRILHGTKTEGRLSLDEYPMWREPLDCATDTETRELTIISGAQTGKTSACRMMIACLVDRDPAPAIVALPSKAKVRLFAKGVMNPTVRSIPSLDRQLGSSASERNENCTLDAVRLHHGSIIYRWVGADPDQLKSDPAKYGYFDECERMPVDVGGEGDPYSLLRNRQRMWHNTRKLLDSTTPGVLEGMGARRFLSAGCRLRYYVPCLECGEHAIMAAAGTGLAAPKKMRGEDPIVESSNEGPPDELEQWYGSAPRFGLWVNPAASLRRLEQRLDEDAALVCPHCGAHAHEENRREMVQRGRFVSSIESDDGEESETIDQDGVIHSEGLDGEPVAFEPSVDPKPSTSRHRSSYAAFSLNVLSSPVVKLVDVAFEMKRAFKGGRAQLQAFVNNWLAEPWIERSAAIYATQLRRRITHDQAMMTLPEWTTRTLLVADTQQDGWWWTLFAIGPGSRTHYVGWDFIELGEEGDDGVPDGWRRLEALADRFLPVWKDGAPSGVDLQCAAMVVDSGGDKTADVYRWCQRWRQGFASVPAHPVKGDNRAGLPWLTQMAAAPQGPDGKPDPDATRLILVNTHAAKDRLARLLNARAGVSASATFASDVDATTGEKYDGAHEELFKQLTSEHKIVELVGKPGRGKLKQAAHVWRLVKSGRANHLLDVSAYFVAVAERLKLWDLEEDDPDVVEMRIAVERGQVAPRVESRAGVRENVIHEDARTRPAGDLDSAPTSSRLDAPASMPEMPSMERIRAFGGRR